MSAPHNETDPPLAEPGKRASGGDVGGMRSTADAGIAAQTQRSLERGDESPLGAASTGGGAAARDPRVDLGGKNAPGSADTPSGPGEGPAAGERAAPGSRAAPTAGRTDPAAEDDDGDTWRHAPIAPVDEKNPLKSFGRAVADAATGGAEDTSKQPKR